MELLGPSVHVVIQMSGFSAKIKACNFAVDKRCLRSLCLFAVCIELQCMSKSQADDLTKLYGFWTPCGKISTDQGQTSDLTSSKRLVQAQLGWSTKRSCCITVVIQADELLENFLRVFLIELIRFQLVLHLLWALERTSCYLWRARTKHCWVRLWIVTTNGPKKETSAMRKNRDSTWKIHFKVPPIPSASRDTNRT